MIYEHGKWYWFEGGGHRQIARFSHISVSTTHFVCSEVYNVYGWGQKDTYCIDLVVCKGLATPKQIESCLVAYAKENGYIEGAYAKHLFQKDELFSIGSEIEYSEHADSVCSNGFDIYYQGKWAEIVKRFDGNEK